MFSTLITVALFAAASIRGVAADPFQIATPTSVKQCQEVDLSWSGGSAPFNIIAVPAADPCADALYDLGDSDQWTKKWTPKLPAGTYMLSLLDTTGEETWSGEITVEAGDNSCVPANLLASASSAAAASSSAAASSVLSSASVAVTGTTSPSTSGTVGPVGAVGSEPFQSSGASHTTAPVMVLGALAAIAAFIL
ncbi:hypothetical protein K435DRAFT_643434 [Dendrothele bispora CBS 962.96]|uniref:Uncharacterized protein n=1 Tax=Dendrothele bispora (strain CBS 962.96) TaxID=1314807 RepID=A0A4S8MXB4_DENBC|nr:hypothetical protein K435DRAFT_643434 [Dendrothele bispora CBS 962.96]